MSEIPVLSVKHVLTVGIDPRIEGVSMLVEMEDGRSMVLTFPAAEIVTASELLGSYAVKVLESQQAAVERHARNVAALPMPIERERGEKLDG